MRLFMSLILLVCVLSLYSCKNEDTKVQKNVEKNVEKDSTKKIDKVIAFTINDRPVYKNQLAGRDIDAAINDEILYEVALINGEDKNPKVIQLIDRYKHNLIVGRYKGNIIKSHIKSVEISEEDLKKYFDSNKSKYSRVDVRKISSENKEIAEDVYNKLKDGKDINSIVESYSKDNVQIEVTNITNNRKYNDYFTEFKVNEISNLQSERNKFNIYQITDVHILSFSRAKRNIRYHFVNEQKASAIQQELEKAKKEHNFIIEIINR